MICPDCIETMIVQKKKLGHCSSKWLVCPKCGCRLKEDWPITETYKLGKFIDERERINKNKNDYKDF